MLFNKIINYIDSYKKRRAEINLKRKENSEMIAKMLSELIPEEETIKYIKRCTLYQFITNAFIILVCLLFFVLLIILFILYY